MLLKGVDDFLHFAVLLSLAIRWAVSRFPYSGYEKPPMYGDYEAQRHWMEITVNLPVQEWYRNTTNNDLLYWGLDYPPLTAYHSFVCGYIAKWINSDWVSLHTSKGHESYFHKIFMRSSVLVSDLPFYIAVILYWNFKPWNLRDKAVAAGLCFLYPGLILIDHGHFQYNSVSLGLSLWALVFFSRGRDLAGAAAFTLALQFKQMTLYHALPVFCYLLGSCLKLSTRKGVVKIGQLSVVVVLVFLLCWLPFLRSFDDITSVLQRLFPFSRGLFEDKVANVWCMLSIFIKLKNMFTVSSLVKICAGCTLLSVLPSSVHLLLHPTLRNLRIALVVSSLSFFMFSYQVHEKSILLVALPMLLLIRDHPLTALWFAHISAFSLLPLLARDGLTVPCVALSALFLIGALRAFHGAFVRAPALLLSTFCLSVLGCVALLAAMFAVRPPPRLPHLHALLNCLWSGAHFLGFLARLNWLQLAGRPSSD